MTHPYNQSHPVHCPCNRVEPLGILEYHANATTVITLAVLDCGVIMSPPRVRSSVDCDVVLDTDRDVS